LDIGCGPGHFTASLDPAVKVTFVDLSANMLEVAGNKRPGSVCRVHDFHDPFPDDLRGFDVVLAVACLEFCRDLSLVMKNIAPTMAEGAHAYMTIVERTDGATRVPVAPADWQVPELYCYSLAEMIAAIDAAGLTRHSYTHNPGWFSGHLKRDVHYVEWVLTR